MGAAESPSAVRKAQRSTLCDTYFVQLPGSIFVGVGEALAVVVVAVGVLVLVAVLVGMASTQ